MKFPSIPGFIIFIMSIAPPMLLANSPSLTKAFSMSSGNPSRRRVWPVGAVSKTITENSIDWMELMSSAKPSASSMPGID